MKLTTRSFEADALPVLLTVFFLLSLNLKQLNLKNEERLWPYQEVVQEMMDWPIDRLTERELCRCERTRSPTKFSRKTL